MTESLTLLLTVWALHTALVATPGPSLVLIVQTSAAHGRGRGVVTSAGVGLISGLWAAVALGGLTVLFAAVPWIYGGLKLVGGLYLIWLGLRLWRRAGNSLPPAAGIGGALSYADAFRRGALCNLTNPKSTMFFAGIFSAALPADAPVWVMAAAVVIVAVNAFAWNAAAALALSTRPAQAAYRRARQAIDRLCGAIMIALGLRLAGDFR